MDYESEIEKIRSGLTRYHRKNRIYLEEQLQKYQQIENSEEIRKEITRMINENLSDKDRRKLEKKLFTINEELNERIKICDDLYNDERFEEALKIADEVIAKADAAVLGDPERGYFSFNEDFEMMMYLTWGVDWSDSRSWLRARPQFSIISMSRFYLRKANCLYALKRYSEAREVLADARHWNPVEADPYIADAGCLAALGDLDEAWVQIRKGQSFAYRRELMAHAYGNAANLLFAEEDKDEDAAALFALTASFTESANTRNYFYSVLYAFGYTGDKIPSPKECAKVAAKYGLSVDPQKNLKKLAVHMAELAEKYENYEEACYYYDIAFEISQAKKYKDIIKKLQAKIEEE